MAADSSRLRQQLASLGTDRQRHLGLVLDERGPLVRGSLGTRSRVCGKPSCRCARGELHQSKYLSASQDGRVRQVHIPARDEVEVADGVARYRRFHEARARLAELASRQLELVDALGRSLLRPYPEDKPLPPAKRPGTRRVAGGDHPR
jgi:hypothetical protein